VLACGRNPARHRELSFPFVVTSGRAAGVLVCGGVDCCAGLAMLRSGRRARQKAAGLNDGFCNFAMELLPVCGDFYCKARNFARSHEKLGLPMALWKMHEERTRL